MYIEKCDISDFGWFTRLLFTIDMKLSYFDVKSIRSIAEKFLVLFDTYLADENNQAHLDYIEQTAKQIKQFGQFNQVTVCNYSLVLDYTALEIFIRLVKDCQLIDDEMKRGLIEIAKQMENGAVYYRLSKKEFWHIIRKYIIERELVFPSNEFLTELAKEINTPDVYGVNSMFIQR